MKCIRCNHDSKYPQRTGRVCPQCKGRFAFEPREGDLVSDMLFRNAIEAVSAYGTVYFGVENLYYEVCRRNREERVRALFQNHRHDLVSQPLECPGNGVTGAQ